MDTNANANLVVDIPCVDLSKDPAMLKQGSKEWKLASQEIKEALDTHGYFLVKYDAISNDEQKVFREAIPTFFDLPLEAKKAVSNYKETFATYRPRCPELPFYESLKFEHALQREDSEAFTRLTWPQVGNDKLCTALSPMSIKFVDLTQVVIKMLLDGYGLEKHAKKMLEASSTPFGMIKYSTLDELGQDYDFGLPEHVDPNYLTILGPNEVAGLMIKNKLGEWVPVPPTKSHFVVFVGRALEVLTNGRLQATFHKVKVYAGTRRFTYGTFWAPKHEHIVEALPEMVDDEHPLLFKPYAYNPK